MITYSGTIIVSNGDEPKEPKYGDVGPNFSFDDVVALIDEHFEGQKLQMTILRGVYCNAIVFLQEANHERGLRKALFKLLEKLAELGTGIHAHCSLWDYEANDGRGGAWNLRLNHPDLSLDGADEFPFEWIDFTKRDWP